MPEDQQPTPPQEGEQSRAQVPNVPYAWIGGGFTVTAGSPLLFSGGSASNPCGFPGYAPGLESGYYGLYGVYRWMLEHPTIRLARAVVVAPLLASSWFVEHDDDVPEGAVEWVDRAFNNLRPSAMPEVIRGLDYGWQPFEPVWEIGDGGYWMIDRFKPLLVDTTLNLVDPKTGAFLGLQPSSLASAFLTPTTPGQAGQEALDARRGKAWAHVHDGEAGNLYGRSRLENVRRTAWRDWLDCAQQIQALSGKLSGRQAYAIVPAGGYPDPTDTTKQRTFKQDAADALAGFAQGKNPVLTAPALAAAMAGNDLAAIKQMIGAAPVTFNTVDFGTESPAISGLLDRLRYNDGLIFAGYLRSSRTGLESENGSRADSQQHTDTGMTDSQLIGNDICQQLQPLVDLMGRWNWGLRKGAIRLRQSPLVSAQRATLEKLLPMLLSDPTAKATALKVADMDKVLDAVDVPRDGDWDQAEVEAKQEQEKKQREQMKQQHANQLELKSATGVNGNGRMPAAAGEGGKN